METKLFEVRDRGTMIPAIGTKMTATDPRGIALLRRAGYDPFAMHGSALILFTDAQGGRIAHYDEFEFGSARTMSVALQFIRRNWSKLESGDVVDVEFILGETATKKEPE